VHPVLLILGANVFEDIAVRARQLLRKDTSEPVIAHTDWSRRNIRVDAHGPIAVYDWDSLALVRESEALAMGATTWSKTGLADDPTPSLQDIDEYIAVYEARRGAPLAANQRRACGAAVLASMAYTARCEHSIDPHEHTWTTTRPQLRAAAASLLVE